MNFNRRRRSENIHEDVDSSSPAGRRNRRLPENGDNDAAADGMNSSPPRQGQRRSNGIRRRNRTISAAKPEILEKKVADFIDNVGAIKITKPGAGDADKNANEAGKKIMDAGKNANDAGKKTNDDGKKVNDAVKDNGNVAVAN